MTNMWEYGHDQEDWASRRLVGYKVEATDGGVGKIKDAMIESGAHAVVVDTGPLFLGSKVVLPAGLISRVDHDAEQVHVAATKDQLKNAPEYDEGVGMDPSYRESLNGYYGATPAS
jgi:hypothetical protein